MYVEWFSWGSPVGVGIFVAGMGLFFWGLFTGVARLNRSKPSPPAK